MYTVPPKKMLIINVLDILKKYSDENHRLSQKDIIEILGREYSVTVDRKAVKRNLMNLIDFGYGLEHTETVRRNKRGIDEIISSDWYLNRDFTDSELRLLIDSLLFSKHIPYSQCKALIEKLEGLSNTYFKKKVRHIRNLPENMPDNKELFYTIEVLDEAISARKQVSFYYGDYGIDKKRHPRKNEQGEPKEYTVNPYQMVATNGRYYLICSNVKYSDNLSNYRIDHISDIRIIDQYSISPNKKLDLPKHMAEHIYMFSGESIRVEFKAKCHIVGQIIDWFGKAVEFSHETEDEVLVHVRVNETAMFFWVMQYGEYVEVLKPESLRQRVKDAALDIVRTYNHEEGHK